MQSSEMSEAPSAITIFHNYTVIWSNGTDLMTLPSLNQFIKLDGPLDHI